MSVDIIIDLLNDEKVVGLTFLFVTNEEEQIDAIDKNKSHDNILFVTVPKKAVINLNYVVKINTISKFEGSK